MQKISILTPTYNRNKFLELYIENIKKQTYPKHLLKVYILDDGEEAFINDLEKVKEELKPIEINYINCKAKRLTIGAKRNKLVKLADTKIVCFMDDDDIYQNQYIEYSYNQLKLNKVSLVGSNQMLFTYPHHNYEMTGLNCGDNKQMIHEATMMMTKKYFRCMGGFNNSSQGEGVNIILNQDKNILNLDINNLMICVCHNNNTIDKERFLNNKLYLLYDGERLPILKKIFNAPQ